MVKTAHPAIVTLYNSAEGKAMDPSFAAMAIDRGITATELPQVVGIYGFNPDPEGFLMEYGYEIYTLADGSIKLFSISPCGFGNPATELPNVTWGNVDDPKYNSED